MEDQLTTDNESSKIASRPASAIMEERVTDMIPEEPVMSQPDSPDDSFQPDISLNARSSAESSRLQPETSDAINTRPDDWERREKDNGVPYYVDHVRKKTVWTHPDLTEFITGLQVLNEIRFPAYRTAIKLRKIQMKLTSDNFNIENMQKAFRTVSPDPTATIEVIILAEILYDLYENSKRRAYQADLTLNWLLSVFNPKREGTIPVLCVKVGLVALCGAQLEQKYRYLFTATSGAKRTMNKEGLKALVYVLSQIPYHLNEHVAFVGNELNVDPTVESCFQHRANPKSPTLHMDDFMNWCSLQPESIVWLPILHRTIAAEKVTHNVKCQCCRNKDFTGFRYKSLKRFRHDLCQECYLYGKANEKKLVHSPLVEYYNPTGIRENIRDFMRTAQNKIPFLRKKNIKLDYRYYLPINPQQSP
ncbi:Oidioi.mRNA.OKI2018_I69.PAR.g10285.t1.cds [Oikopleura dioica]|uniref:Oidioi.mRNA.OKI2018_I69.PAR.g10285.t1.cds n=1 Tax=Oikopleura dioica TaxID=34765 RepID=A0ABN7RQX1_OIKDI|nr:Oidioi.mRNA.OKI2018_I69.PAR.g10285.t1.cds [Oikopleura dioica]